MPVGALVRSVLVVSIQGHYRVVELNTTFGEVLTCLIRAISSIPSLVGARAAGPQAAASPWTATVD